MLSRIFPMPLDSGDKIRVYHVLRELSKRHEIDLLVLVRQDVELEYLGELKQICREVYPFKLKFSKKISAAKSTFSKYPWDAVAFYNKELKHKVNDLLSSEDFDIIWIHFLSMAINIDFNLVREGVVILDQHNADELFWRKIFQDSNNFGIRLFARQNLNKLRKFQMEIIDSFNAILCVSDEDAKFMKEQVPAHIKILTVPNGVDLDYFQPSNANNKERNITMFCGSMDTLMNVEAVLQFANEIFPLVREKIPDSEFWVVGRNPVKQVRDLVKQEHIKVTGSVEDIRPYYDKAKVFVAPFKLGGGTKLKILEAMAMKVPIVSTSVGCQGIDVINGVHLIIEDDMKRFAEAIRSLLLDEDRRNKVAINGRKLVEEKYSWEGIMENIEPKLTQLVREKELK